MKNSNKSLTFLVGMLFLLMPIFAFAQEEVIEEESSPPVAEETSEDPAEESIKEEDAPVVDAGEFVEEDPVPELIAEPEIEVEEPDVAPLSEVSIPAVMINVEQQSWNTFKFRPSFQLGARGYDYAWEFGDGEQSNQRIVEHTFSKPGTFRVVLALEDGVSIEERASIQVHIGFFNLANWRLWVLVGLLASIIIVAAIIAGLANDVVDKDSSKKDKPSDIELEPLDEIDDEEPLVSLSEETGDLDSMASTGMPTEELSDELALLESLDKTADDSKNVNVAMEELLSDEPEEEEEKDVENAVESEDIIDVDLETEEDDDMDLDALLTDVEEKPKTEKPQKKIKKKTPSKKKVTKAKKPQKKKKTPKRSKTKKKKK